jgi:hypothetical protein
LCPTTPKNYSGISLLHVKCEVKIAKLNYKGMTSNFAYFTELVMFVYVVTLQEGRKISFELGRGGGVGV